MAESSLQVHNLTTVCHTDRGDVAAVEGVSFHVERGEILGLVGSPAAANPSPASPSCACTTSAGRSATGARCSLRTGTC